MGYLHPSEREEDTIQKFPHMFFPLELVLLCSKLVCPLVVELVILAVKVKYLLFESFDLRRASSRHRRSSSFTCFSHASFSKFTKFRIHELGRYGDLLVRPVGVKAVE